MSETVYGLHAIEALLARSPERIIEVFIIKGREDKRLLAVVRQLEQLGLPVKIANRQWLDEKSKNGVHQGILAMVTPNRGYQENDIPLLIEQQPNPVILILDGVTDPHNLGACIRTADAAGVDFIIVPKDRSAPLNSTAQKVACGAAESVPVVRVTNLARTMRMLQDEYQVWIVGTAGEADRTLYQTDFYKTSTQTALALVMGAEGEGMRRLTKEHCDELVSIPMAGIVSSLNVSVATGVCLFEIVRQKSAIRT
ncbi:MULTISPECIES: 23S rRNA (guanosine(2251)-2'-O)-methyltransferase RlmB [unclassified Gilliamella]|uniref:23S rRNA (guanosine(2251)-2'-O)-methyltransferase RlmB n=1 Tax=unclassified Gilliamella TaxID=2685620 RepID=UPI00080E236D|nr:23S rRNA (guanosine(2251)-2'-O)-methyltransferase RlmB [Gilliamella apicola]OCG33943.1 23S rRNA (guanosine(2251)-2'-O)-methyltransferase RlmB [Gilliamella apicola]OCG52066.1 23S rRNA (guanosine(2251)-2'-O)-methyltransferase RlmB [Gilliamella apicola]OCG52891.1 23S rRNA (guanosine(2251)-2'-O)-methyltransferase RlmB [Gilliamella apicola]